MRRLSSHLGQGLPAVRILFLHPGHQIYSFPNSLGNPSMCYPDILKLQLSFVTLYLNQWSPTFLVPATSFLVFPWTRWGQVWFLDDSDILHLLCTLFLLSVPPQIYQALDPRDLNALNAKTFEYLCLGLWGLPMWCQW